MMARAACSGLVSLAALDSLLGGRDRVRGTRAHRYPVQRPPPVFKKKIAKSRKKLESPGAHGAVLTWQGGAKNRVKRPSLVSVAKPPWAHETA